MPTLAVLREAQHDPPPLTQWCLGDAGARLSGDLLNLACLEPCVQEQLLGAESHLLEPVTRDLRRLPVEEFDEGVTPPQRERLRERVRGAFGFTELELLRTALEESLEPLGIHLDVLPTQSIAVRGGLDPRRRDEPAQPHDAPPNDMRPRGGRIVAPDRCREGCVRQGFTEADCERTHHCTIPRSQRNPTVVERQRSKNAHLHSATVTPTPTSVKTADIGPIQARWAPLSC